MIEYVRSKSNQSRYSRGHVSSQTKVLQTLSTCCEFAGRNRAGDIARRRDERTRRGFACFACWLRQFVLVAVAAARLGPPTLSGPPRSTGSSAALLSVGPCLSTHVSSTIPAGAPSLLISLFGPPSVAFHFCFCAGYASTSRGYSQYLGAIDR